MKKTEKKTLDKYCIVSMLATSISILTTFIAYMVITFS